MWFQQNGATPNLTNETIQLLGETFNNRVISGNGDINGPTKSSDLIFSLGLHEKSSLQQSTTKGWKYSYKLWDRSMII